MEMEDLETLLDFTESYLSSLKLCLTRLMQHRHNCDMIAVMNTKEYLLLSFGQLCHFLCQSDSISSAMDEWKLLGRIKNMTAAEEKV